MVLAAVLLIAIAYFVFNNVDLIRNNSDFLWESRGYSFFPMRTSKCIIVKIGYYVIVSSIILAILVLCPKSNGMITMIGSRTLGIYICHRVLRDIIRDLGIYNYFDNSELSMLTFCVVISVVNVVLFSGKRLNKLCNLPFKAFKNINTDQAESTT